MNYQLVYKYFLLFNALICLNRALAQNRPQIGGPIYSSVLGIGSEPVLFNDVNLTSYEIISTNVIFSEKDKLQKMVIMPFLFSKSAWSEKSYWQEGLKINLANKEGISTLGIGFDVDRTKSTSDNFIDDYNLAYGTRPTLTTWLESFMTRQELDAVNTNNTVFSNLDQLKRKHEKLKEIYKKVEAIYSARSVNKAMIGKWKNTIGANIQFFEVIAGKEIDLNADSLIDNKYGVKGFDISASFMYVASQRIALNFVARHQNKRTTSIENQKLVPYLGGSFNIAWRAGIFGNNAIKEDKLISDVNRLHRLPITIYDYELSENFQNKYFIPSWYIGLSFETNNAIKNEEFAEDNMVSKYVFTPFLDFKISPTSQFRVTVPISLNKKIVDDVTYGPYLQWTFQLINLN